MFIECMVINDKTNAVELRELTETMAENLSEIATVMSVNFIGDKTTVWRNRVPSVERVSRSTLLELKRRAIWYDEHLGITS